VSTRRRKRSHQPAQAATATAPAREAQAPPALPEYNWRTFPVYFAFWLGAFIGLYAGILAQASDNTLVATVIFIVIAFFLGLGVSRLGVVWMMRHQWVKPRPRRR
jgi:hypothetical protein